LTSQVTAKEPPLKGGFLVGKNKQTLKIIEIKDSLKTEVQWRVTPVAARPYDTG
jgi:hypothetical protein